MNTGMITEIPNESPVIKASIETKKAAAEASNTCLWLKLMTRSMRPKNSWTARFVAYPFS
jgi:hypothetical protein